MSQLKGDTYRKIFFALIVIGEDEAVGVLLKKV